MVLVSIPGIRNLKTSDSVHLPNDRVIIVPYYPRNRVIDTWN